MSAHLAFPRGGLVATALAKAESWLLEPAEESFSPPLAEVQPRPVVAVVGLAGGCGTTTVARALAAELGARDPAGASAVSCDEPSGTGSLRTAAAVRLGRSLAPHADGRIRCAGRLCILEPRDEAGLAAALRYLAPLVIEVGYGAPSGCAAALADHVVLVAAPEVEPALAAVVAASLARVGPEPLLVLNRADEPGRWREGASIWLPESRAGARLASGGHAPRGALGEGIGELADICEETRAAHALD